MKALTVQQPFATLLIRGPKVAENRPWYTAYRGPLAIHAGASDSWQERGRLACQRAGAPYPEDCPTGVILGVMDLVKCVEFEPRSLFPDPELADDPWATGPYCLILRNPRPLPEPIPCRGFLGLWTPEDAILAVLERLAQGLEIRG